ncbi:hypothetical protein BDB01DRAFT_780346 [Pilobolus umbonatus]|nr:hypothetical protein BDB01DRAFT_780346 [Pilobolus umbonatus]
MSVSIDDIRESFLHEAQDALSNPYMFDKAIKTVAVIGAGPSGLASARHLRSLGFNVRIFDRNSTVGGMWVYSERPAIKPKIPSSRVTRASYIAREEAPNEGTRKSIFEMTPETMHLVAKKCPSSACYRDMYNNIPTKFFEFPDFPFPEGTEHWCHHTVTSEYLEEYATKYELHPLISFDTSVDELKKDNDTGIWELKLSKYDVYGSGLVKISHWKERVDAVVVASGAHQQPYVPDYKNLIAWNKIWPKKVSHSKQFRHPEDFQNKRVLIVGAKVSAVDIARYLDGFAKAVYMSVRGPVESLIPYVNIVRGAIPASTIIKPEIVQFANAEGTVDGSILFQDGTILKHIDHVIFCTGYTISYDFLKEHLIKSEFMETNDHEQQRGYDVSKSQVVTGIRYPLNVYKEVFAISDPTLAFVGLQPEFSTPFHFDIQATAVARVWSGHACLPDTELMNHYTNNKISLEGYVLGTADRIRRDQFVVWLNSHEKVLGNGDEELPELTSYADDYEEESVRLISLWPEESEVNLKKMKDEIIESLELLS